MFQGVSRSFKNGKIVFKSFEELKESEGAFEEFLRSK